jgi:hypothetical protein
LAVVLLNSIGDKYKDVKSAIEYGRDTLTTEIIINALRTKELELKSDRKESSSGLNLMVKSKFNPRNNYANKKFGHKKKGNQKDKMKIKGKNCFYCQEERHFIRDCPKRLSDNRNKFKMDGDAALVCNNETYIDEVYVAVAHQPSQEWILDSGCTYHMCPNKDWFCDFENVNGGQVLMGNHMACQVKGIGTITLRVKDNNVLVLEKTRYVPDLQRNLISLGVLDDLNYDIMINAGYIKILRNSHLIVEAPKRHGLYILQTQNIFDSTSAALSVSNDKSQIWHKRLGHISDKGLQILKKQGAFGNDNIEKLSFCDYCILGKHNRLPFLPGMHKSVSILEYLHADLWGPANVPTHTSFKYFLLIIDDFSRKNWIFLLKSKSDTFTAFKDWKTLIENQTDKRVKVLRTDNGLEFCNYEFDDLCKLHGILRHRTVTHTPQQNGLAERMNRTLLEKVRCMLLSSGLPKLFWGEATKTASYLINRSPASAIHFKTPEEVWNGRPVDLSNLRVFGCAAFAHQYEGKLDPRALKCVFLGYGEGVKGYRLWVRETKGYKIIISRNVVFNEDDLPCLKTDSSSGPLNQTDSIEREIEIEVEQVGDDNQLPNIQTGEVEVDVDVESHRNDEVDHCDTDLETNQTLGDYQLARDRQRRQVRPPVRFDDEVSLLTVQGFIESEPVSYDEAMSSKDSKHWLEAMQDEMESLKKNKTWVLTSRPKGKRVVDCKWIFKLKRGEQSENDIRYKARLVAKGFTQKEGIDFNEIFSPVVKFTTVRVILALATQFNWELEQLDVKTAFLNGDLDETIYMEQPKGFEMNKNSDLVCLLKKSLYGLKQAPRQWYKRFDTFVLGLGFKRSNFDTCLYCKGNGGENSLYLLLYVDDMILASHDIKEIELIKTKLKSEFEMKDLGPVRKILGIEIKRNRREGILSLSQKSYVLKLLEKFSISDAKSVSVPLANHFKLSSDQSPKSEFEFKRMARVPYSNAVGSVMYLMVCSRPDLAFSISVLSRFMSNPGETHWEAMKWLLRYIKGTCDLGIHYRKQSDGVILRGYTDSDYAGDRDNRKSTSAYVYTLCNSCISWKSQLQKIVALSSTEVEYIAATDAIKEGIWLKGLLNEFGFVKDVVLFSDSQSAIYLSRNPVLHNRSKHVDVKFHFIRDVISQGVVKLKKISTHFNPADVGTKVLPLNKFLDCLKLLNIDTC